MSSPISADYSPTSNYSYPSDLSLSPVSLAEHIRYQNDQIPPPRLSSPHIFRNIFVGEAAGPSTRSPPRLPPLHEIAFAETMQDVNRALQSANRAIQNAQEAFQSRQPSFTNGNRRQDVVDLTNSPPSPSRNNRSMNFDSFLARTLEPHVPQSSDRLANSSTNAPFFPGTGLSTHAHSLFIEEDDPTSRYAGQSDSLAGAQRRHLAQTQSHHNRRSYLTIPNMERSFIRSSIPNARRQEEEEAIRRQRVAREQWQQTQQRQQQRDRLQQNAIRGSARTDQEGGLAHMSSSSPVQQSTATSSGAAPHPRSPPSRPTSAGSSVSSLSVESVDLTSVNNTTDLAAALLHSQSSNPIANPANSSVPPRSALTAYKCPICLEAPRNATTTICGHLFCHECILETLKNSETIRREDAPPHRKVKGQCPVCRKELARKEDEGPQRTLVPLELKLISKKDLKDLRKQEKKRRRASDKTSKGKGKQKAATGRDKEIFEVSSDDEDGWDSNGNSQNNAKRVKLSTSEELDQELFGAYTHDEQG